MALFGAQSLLTPFDVTQDILGAVHRRDGAQASEVLAEWAYEDAFVDGACGHQWFVGVGRASCGDGVEVLGACQMFVGASCRVAATSAGDARAAEVSNEWDLYP